MSALYVNMKPGALAASRPSRPFAVASDNLDQDARALNEDPLPGSQLFEHEAINQRARRNQVRRLRRPRIYDLVEHRGGITSQEDL